MSIGSTRNSPDNVRTCDSSTYSQFLKIFDRPPVGHDITIITSFDIPCSLWPVVPSFEFAGIWFILHCIGCFLKDVRKCFTFTSGENFSGSRLSFQLSLSFDNFSFSSSRLSLFWCLSCTFSNSCICASSCKMYYGLLTCSHCKYITSFASIVHTFFSMIILPLICWCTLLQFHS